MKIVFVIHQFYPEFGSGTEAVTLNLATMLQYAGNRVAVVAYCPSHIGCEQTSQGARYKDYIYNGIPVTAYHLEHEPRDINYGLPHEETEPFARIWLERQKPDIVHIMHPMRVCGFLTAAQSMGIPTVVTTTDLMYVCAKIIMSKSGGQLCTGAEGGYRCNTDCADTGSYHEERMAFAYRCLSAARAITAPSQFICNAVTSAFPSLTMKVILHGMVYAGIVQNNRSYAPGITVTFGYVGTIERHKGLHFLLEAFHRVNAPNIRLRIYGDPTTAYGLALQRKYQNDLRVTFCGAFNKETREAAYATIDMLVVPSLCYESYSLVKHEAIIRNIPVAVAALGALPENIENGKNGFVFDTASSNTLMEVLQSVALDPSVLNRCKDEMKLMIVPTIEQESFAYLRLYKRILHGNSRRSD